tara:strand:- start:89 stop:262 length:174 start_codon:yes stop_codon:yes gene_type:complete
VVALLELTCTKVAARDLGTFQPQKRVLSGHEDACAFSGPWSGDERVFPHYRLVVGFP